MRASSLFLVFVLAKIAILWGHAAPLTGWSVLAYTWQDALVALVFAAVAGITPKIAVPTYGALVIYAAINIPVGRILATPLTLPMLRAARGPLSDSILLYLTATNVLLILSILAAATCLPSLIRLPESTILFLTPLILLGPTACSRVDTRGMDRNVITALLGDSLPRATAKPNLAEWRESHFAASPAENLVQFKGKAQKLNVVLISLESTAAQYLRLYGSPYDVTPNLEKLAQHALVFDNAYAVYPESIKGLFSVLCSAFPAFDSRPEDYETVPCKSVVSVLADQGYRTAMFHSGRFDYLGMQSIVRNRGYQTLEDAGAISGNRNSSFGVDEPTTVARMLSWIDSLPSGQRFFLNYLPIAGHHPYATPGPGPFGIHDEIDQYRNALHYGDASLGVLIEGLRARGLDQNTLFIVYGDHGEAFHQHEGNYGHTFFLYDENIHVPFLIAAPGLMPKQERVGNVVSLVDIAPTVLDLMGIPAPPTYQGRTMLDATPRMALFFADYSLGLLGLRDGPFKFIREIGSGRTKLFNLDRDPRELSDLSSLTPERTAWYTRVVRDWSAGQHGKIARTQRIRGTE